MRYLLLTLLLIFPALVSAQELHTFSNGNVADAAKINENFQYVLENASGGCSATQQDNPVLIDCPDGTTGVIVGAGTVVQLGEGVVGEAPPINFDTGAIVCIDGDDTIIAEASGQGDTWCNAMTLLGNIRLVNDSSSNTVLFGSTNNGYVFYTEADCEGAALVRYQGLYMTGGELFSSSESSLGSVFYSSYRRSGYVSLSGAFEPESTCINRDLEGIARGYSLLVPYTPAAEIVNAVYPIRVEQLP